MAIAAASHGEPDFIVDRKTLQSDDVWAIIEPAWWNALVYGSHQEYVKSLEPFSERQRLLVAVVWYASEVNSLGHWRFYGRGPGIVWQDALAGLKALGMKDVELILQQSIARMGGAPPLGLEERRRRLAERDPNFDDLDEQLRSIWDQDEFRKPMLTFIRKHPEDFLYPTPSR